MDFFSSFSQWMTIAFLIFLGFLVLLNFINLPANWIVIVLIAIWSFFHSDNPQINITYWCSILATAVVGEILEWVVLAQKSKAAGASSWGTFAGMLGAFAGAIMGAPFFLGLGALFGALLGAFLGCLGMELLRGNAFDKALEAAKGTLLGRFLGALCKCAAGFTIVAISARRLTTTAQELTQSLSLQTASLDLSAWLNQANNIGC